MSKFCRVTHVQVRASFSWTPTYIRIIVSQEFVKKSCWNFVDLQNSPKFIFKCFSWKIQYLIQFYYTLFCQFLRRTWNQIVQTYRLLTMRINGRGSKNWIFILRFLLPCKEITWGKRPNSQRVQEIWWKKLIFFDFLKIAPYVV